MSQTQPPVTAEAVAATFDQLFREPEGTVLVAGAEEPFYLPGYPSQVFFRFESLILRCILYWKNYIEVCNGIYWHCHYLLLSAYGSINVVS